MAGPPPEGFLVLDKPAGQSSARALNAIKRRLPPRTKVGHAGTLDPFATGVLVVLVGKATRSCERIMGLPKGYQATLRLGATTATLDPESPEILTDLASDAVPTRRQIEEALARFVGEIRQVPPAFSALKLGGRRAYDLARAGREVTLPSRPVLVHRLELLDYSWPEVRLLVECGRGFYVRSLARDVGETLKTGAYLTSLRRTFIGPFTESLATAPDRSQIELLPLDWLDTRA